MGNALDGSTVTTFPDDRTRKREKKNYCFAKSDTSSHCPTGSGQSMAGRPSRAAPFLRRSTADCRHTCAQMAWAAVVAAAVVGVAAAWLPSRPRQGTAETWILDLLENVAFCFLSPIERPKPIGRQGSGSGRHQLSPRLAPPFGSSPSTNIINRAQSTTEHGLCLYIRCRVAQPVGSTYVRWCRPMYTPSVDLCPVRFNGPIYVFFTFQ
jgi:hypothetical protein